MSTRTRQPRSSPGQGPPLTAPAPRLHQAAVLALLVIASAVAYFNALPKEFFFDDAAGELILNPQTSSLPDAFLAFRQSPFSSGEQLARLTFAMNSAFNRAVGLPPLHLASFFAVNLIIHALNVCLVYFLLRRLLSLTDTQGSSPIGLPLVLALLFAVHPIHASSLAYIGQRRGTMATAFYLLAILAYLRLRGDQRRAAAWSWKHIALAAAIPVCYWLSYRSKSLGLTLPLTMLMIEFCLRAPDRAALRRYLRYLVPGILLCAVAGLIFLRSQGLLDTSGLRILPYGDRRLHGPWTQFLTESRVFAHYWKLLLLPLPAWMCVDHMFELSHGLLDGLTPLAIAFHAALLALGVIAAFRRWTVAAIGIFWFYITLSPYALVPQADVFVEYKTYLASVGLFLLLAEIVRHVPARIPVAAKLAVATALLAALLVTTLLRNSVYRTPLNFWSDVLAKYPLHPRAHHNLATALKDAGNLAEAVQHCRAALRVAPGYAQAHNTLGVALAGLGQRDEAMQEYRAALQIDPQYVNAHYNLGNALQAARRFPEAIAEYNAAHELDPRRLQPYIMCANALSEQMRYNDAAAELRKGLESARPDENPIELAHAHFNLGNAYFRSEEVDWATTEYQKALQLAPEYCNAYYGLGLALQQQGREKEAIEAYSAALAIEPGHAEIRHALEALMARPGPQNPPASQP